MHPNMNTVQSIIIKLKGKQKEMKNTKKIGWDSYKRAHRKQQLPTKCLEARLVGGYYETRGRKA